MDKILAAAFKIIEGLAKGLIIALPQLIDKLPQIIDSLVNFLVNNLPLIISVGFQIIVALAGALVNGNAPADNLRFGQLRGWLHRNGIHGACGQQ